MYDTTLAKPLRKSRSVTSHHSRTAKLFTQLFGLNMPMRRN
jgi:hypothetical protein